MAVAAFFAALMFHQAYSKQSILGVEAETSNHGWLSTVGSALIAAVGLAALVITLA
jgi:hypothetical protein